MDVAIRLLGPTEVGADGVLSPRDRVVLSALCVQPGQAVPAEVLADALWGEAPPKTWGKVVQGSVMRLRRTVGPSAIQTTAAGYRMVLPGGLLDTVEFERLVARGRSFLAVNEPQRAATTFEQALGFWRGPPFPELVDWDPARAEGARLLDVRRAVEEDLVEAHLAAGRAVDAAAEARPLVAREPYRERRWALLATALYRTGRQGEALDVLRQASRTMRDQLGLDPGPELVELQARILAQDPTLSDVPNRIGGSSATCPYRGLRPFDAQDADFYFGRDAVVTEAVRRLQEFPLLIVVGPSGSGKSSLVRAGIVPAMAHAGHRASVVTPGPDALAALTTAIAGLYPSGLLVVDQLEDVFANADDREVTREFLDRLAARVEAGTRVVATLRADYLGWLAESPQLSRLAERGLLLLTPLTENELRAAIEEPARLVGLILEPGLVDVLVRDVAGAPGGLPLLSHALAETWEHRDGTVMTVDGYRATGGIQSAVAQSAERLHDSLTPSDRDVLRTVLLRLVTPTPAGEPVVTRVPTRVFAGSTEAPRLIDLLVRSRLVTVAHDTVTIAHESLVRAWPRLRTWLDQDVEGQRILAHLQVTADTWDTLGRPDDELYRAARLAAAREWRTRTHPVLAPVEDDFLTAATATADAEHLRQVRRNRLLRGALVAAIVLLAVALVAGTLARLNGQAAQTEAGRASAEAGRAAAEASRADEAAMEALGARLAATALSEPNPRLALLLARQGVAISDSPTTQGALLSSLMNAQSLLGLAQSRWGPTTDTLDHMFTPDGRALLHVNSRGELDLLNTATGISLHGVLADTDNWQQYSVSGNRRPPPSPLVNRWNASGYPTGLIDGGRVAVLSHATDPKPTAADPSMQQASVGLLPIDVATGDPAGPRQRVPGAIVVLKDDVIDHEDRPRISPDGRTLISVLDGQVRIWHRRGQRWAGPQSVAIPGIAPQDTERTVLAGATFTSNGERAAVMFNRMASPAIQEPGGVVVDLTRKRLIGPAFPQGRRSGLSHMAISPDGTRLLVGDREGPVLVRRLADNEVLNAIPGQSPATVVAWSPNGQQVALGRLNGTSEVYSLNPLQRIMVSSGSDRVSALAFVGAHGLARESITGSIARYDLAALSPVATQVATAPIHAIAAAAGLIAQGEDNGRVTIRDARTLKQIGQKLWLGPYAHRDQRPDVAIGRGITAVAMTPDGSAVIAADRLGHLRMWSLPGREVLWSRNDVPTSWLAVSPNSRYLATVGNTVKGGVPDGDPLTSALTLWDLNTHNAHLSEDLTNEKFHSVGAPEQFTPTPRTVVFSPDGSKVAAAFIDGPVLIYDVALGRRTRQLDTFLTAPSSLAFSPDGKRLLAASPDYLREWNPTTGEQLSRTFVPGLRDFTRMTYTDAGRWLVISHPRSMTVLDAQTLQVAVTDLPLPTEAPTDAFAVDGGQNHQLVVGTASVLASIEMDPERWNTAACELAGRPLTKDEWNRFLPSIPFAPACR